MLVITKQFTSITVENLIGDICAFVQVFNVYSKYAYTVVQEERMHMAENDVALRYLGFWTDYGKHCYVIRVYIHHT